MSWIAISEAHHCIEQYGDDKYTAWLCDFGVSEVEMGDVLYGLVRYLKPKLIVETGAFYGHTTRALGMACQHNECGKVVAVEIKEEWAQVARENTKDMTAVVEVRTGSSLELQELKDADFIFSDSSYEAREQEYALVKLGATFIVHDASLYPPLGEFVSKNGGLVFNKGRGFGMIVKH